MDGNTFHRQHVVAWRISRRGLPLQGRTSSGSIRDFGAPCLDLEGDSEFQDVAAIPNRFLGYCVSGQSVFASPLSRGSAVRKLSAAAALGSTSGPAGNSLV